MANYKHGDGHLGFKLYNADDKLLYKEDPPTHRGDDETGSIYLAEPIARVELTGGSDKFWGQFQVINYGKEMIFKCQEDHCRDTTD